MGLIRKDFDNLCACLPPVSLRNTQNRTTRTAVACLLMKLRLGISNQVLATLFSFLDKRTVARTIHSARKALVGYFVPRFLGFEHISRKEVVNMLTRLLAAELLADQLGRAILTLMAHIFIVRKVQITCCRDAPTACRGEDRWSNPC